MNEFFDKVKNIVSKTAKDAVKVSGDAVEYTKLKFRIGELNDKIYKLYAELGKLVYMSTIDGIGDTDGADEICEQIAMYNLQLEELNKEISSVTNKVICPYCNSRVDSDSTFCSKCGQKF